MERGPLVRELTENGDHRTGQIRPACTARIPGMLDRKPEPKKRTKSDGTSERMVFSSKAKSIRSFLNVNPEQQFEVVRGLASPVRVRILKLLRRRGPLINQISEALGMPQSTIAT